MFEDVTSLPLVGPVIDGVRDPRLGSGRRVALRSFVAGPENRLAAAAVASLIEQAATEYSPLLLVGPAGSGKSHVARGLADWWKEAGRPGPVVVATGEAFAHERQKAQRSGGLLAFRIRYRTAGLLVLDDLHELASKRSAQDELASILDALAGSGAVVIVTSREAVAAHDRFDPRLRSRLAGGLVLSLSPPGRLARQSIALQLAANLGIQLSVQRASQLAESKSANARNLLIGVLAKENPPPDTSSRRPRTGRLPIERIIRSVSRQFALSSEQITGPSRKKTIVLARSIAMYLSRTTTGRSFEQIGEVFGGRDHTTVLYNVRKISRLERTDPTIRSLMSTLRQLLTEDTRK